MKFLVNTFFDQFLNSCQFSTILSFSLFQSWYYLVEIMRNFSLTFFVMWKWWKLEEAGGARQRVNFNSVSGNDNHFSFLLSDSDSGSSAYSEDEDPSFKKGKKPITLKIKREASTRESRSRKRPSFFQEYENEEDNLDKILDEFEQEQVRIYVIWP